MRKKKPIEIKKCPKCEKEHSLKGRFCSPSCANSRIVSKQVKEKIRKKQQQNYASEAGHKRMQELSKKGLDIKEELGMIRTEDEIYNHLEDPLDPVSEDEWFTPEWEIVDDD